MMSEMKSISTQDSFIYHNTKQKNNKKQLRGYLREGKWRGNLKRHRMRLTTFGSLKNDQNIFTIIPRSGV